jgi:predicted anti-sigma-YlaC factor YlaD
MNIKKIDCKDVMNHICESLGEELESQKCIEIKEHLSNCPNCQNYFSSVEKTIEFYKKYDLEVSDDCHERLMKKLGLEDQ